MKPDKFWIDLENLVATGQTKILPKTVWCATSKGAKIIAGTVR